jgi:hypothetical protein
MSVLVIDAGNSIIKAKIARRECGEIAFPHAFKPLTEDKPVGGLMNVLLTEDGQHYQLLN